jgi:hypothetical protein
MNQVVRPQNRKEFMNKLIVPYAPEYGNPNTVFSEPTKLGQPEKNRALDYSLKGDKDKEFKIGMEDLTHAVQYYFDDVLKLFVTQNNTKIKVPVIYGNPERWKAVQKDGYYRDKNSKIMCPIIMFKNSSVEKEYTVGNKLDANNPLNYAVTGKKYQKGVAYSNFDVLNNREPVTNFQAVVIPDYVTLNYECIIWTYYREQMNKIVEAINYSSDSYWGDPSKFKFRARIDTFTDNTTLNQGEERLVRMSFNIKLRGYIIPETIIKDLTSVKRFLSTGKITFNTEIDSTLQ